MTQNCNGIKNGLRSKRWTPGAVLEISNSFKYVVAILNRPIELDVNFMYNLWEQAQLRFTVDGGTNRWVQWLKENKCKFKKSPTFPEYVTGDFDSISKTSVDYIKQSNSTKMIQTPDQDATDFTKALREINKVIEFNSLNIDGVVVVAENSGRLDHILGTLNTLYLAQKFLNIPVFLLSQNSLSWLLKPNCLHSIEIPQILRDRNLWCGLIPLSGKCAHGYTTGLKWNLANTAMEFGGLVSTSNSYGAEAEVTVKADNYLLWTMGISTSND